MEDIETLKKEMNELKKTLEIETLKRELNELKKTLENGRNILEERITKLERKINELTAYKVDIADSSFKRKKFCSASFCNNIVDDGCSICYSCNHL